MREILFFIAGRAGISLSECDGTLLFSGYVFSCGKKTPTKDEAVTRLSSSHNGTKKFPFIHACASHNPFCIGQQFIPVSVAFR